MWQREKNNEEIYRLQEVENTTLYTRPIYGNNLQQFSVDTGDTLNSIPNVVLSPQVGSQIRQHSSFNNVQSRELNRADYGVVGGDVNNVNVDVDQGATCRPVSAGLPCGNIGMVSNQIQDFCNYSNVHGVKRKSEDYSPLYFGTKRRITDEHMAAEMNGLYITNDHDYCNNPAMFNPDDADMQFSTVSNHIEDDDFDLDNDADQGKRGHPIFHFTAPLEQLMKKTNDILPPKILQEIYKPCLAMVPWSPPLHIQSEMTDEHKSKQVGKIDSTKDEMDEEEEEISYP